MIYIKLKDQRLYRTAATHTKVRSYCMWRPFQLWL